MSGGSLVRIQSARQIKKVLRGAFYVYIIESTTTFKWYYGFTEREPKERLIEHNGNHHHFTAHKGPWKLIFIRIFEDKTEALKFEKKLKSLRNKKFIQAEFLTHSSK
jgi:putative endonuclease